MDPNPNTWTFGGTKISTTITSGLVDMVAEEELDATVVHGYKYILCRHVLYHSTAHYVMDGLDPLGVLGSLGTPLQYATLYWERKNELSCDGVASVTTTPATVASTTARLSGGPTPITKNIDMEEWAKQIDQYEAIRNDGLQNKALQVAAIMNQNHPFSVVRAKEILKWRKSSQRKTIIDHLSAEESGKVCSNCKQPVMDGWAYCKHCRNKL